MADIKSGRRATRSGNPVGRPSKTLTDAEEAFCRAELANGVPLTQVHKALLDQRGYFAVVDAKAKKKRNIGRETLRAYLARTLPNT